MSKMQSGIWRTDADGKYKVYIRGCEQQVGTKVEVLARFNGPSYVVTTGTHSKINGGYLYNFRHIRKPEPLSTLSTSTIIVGTPLEKTSITEISTEELDTALGLD